MLTYGFYNSVAGDRLYNAEQMSSIFEGMIHDGIFGDIGDCLRVVAGTGMNIKVGTGRAWFNQTWTKNDSDITLPIDAAHVIFDRVDVVVLEIDSSAEVRANTIKVIKGTPSSSPVIPTLIHTATVNQYPLAYVSVEANLAAITEDYLTNKVGTVNCPYVTGVLRNEDTEIMEGLIIDFSNLVGQFNDIVDSFGQSGEIKYFAMSTAPTGYMKANGAAISRVTYDRLFAAIGTTYGAGDGSTTFNIPDGRGLVARGWDDGRGYDTGRSFGSYQADGNKSHGHTNTVGTESATHYHEKAGSFDGSDMGGLGGVTYVARGSNTVTSNASSTHNHLVTINADGNSEATVKNIAWLCCIKY